MAAFAKQCIRCRVKSLYGRNFMFQCHWRSLSSESADGENLSSFGFKKMPAEDKQRAVNEVFSSVAKRYDLMNDLMSFGLHRLWKREFVARIQPSPTLKLIDVASGTGDIAKNYIESLEAQGHTDNFEPITVCDINQDMLNEGQSRLTKLGLASKVTFEVADARKLPFANNSFDLYTIVFGIRNVAGVDKALSEAQRVLKPGGRFMCMEFSKPVLPFLEKLYDEYSFQVIPALGEVVAGDRDSYQYLVESIREFPNQDTFSEMIRSAGFIGDNYVNFTGGIVAVHSAFKHWR